MRKIESFFLGLNLLQDFFLTFALTQKYAAYDMLHIIYFIFYSICDKVWNSCKIAAGCDITLLDMPDNGKAWNYNNATKRWELECKEKYEIERGQFPP